MLERPKNVPSLTSRIQTHKGPMYVTVGFYKTESKKWQPYELFVSVGHSDPCMKSECEAIGRLTSCLFQSGVGVDVVIKQLENIQCEPHWDNGVQVSSPADGVAKVLAQISAMELQFDETG